MNWKTGETLLCVADKKSFFSYSTLPDDDFLVKVEYVTMLKVGLKQLFYRFR
jgi:hypothetical protein